MSMAAVNFGVGSEAHYSVYRAIAEREYTVDIVYSEGITGKPGERVCVLDADDLGIKICESNEGGSPVRNSTWFVYYDEINTLTII